MAVAQYYWQHLQLVASDCRFGISQSESLLLTSTRKRRTTSDSDTSLTDSVFSEDSMDFSSATAQTPASSVSSLSFSSPMSTTTDDPLRCPKCDRRFSTKSNATRHKDNSCDEKSIIGCNWCPKTFSRADARKPHERKCHPDRCLTANSQDNRQLS